MKVYTYDVLGENFNSEYTQIRFFVPGKCEFGFKSEICEYFTTDPSILKKAQNVIDGHIKVLKKPIEIDLPDNLLFKVIQWGKKYEHSMTKKKDLEKLADNQLSEITFNASLHKEKLFNLQE